MGSAEALHDLQQEQIEQNNDRTAPVNPLAPDEGRHVTLEEYWDKWYEHPYPDIDVSYEWNNGILRQNSWPTRRNSILDSGSLPFSISMSKHTTMLS